jgi:hypothetical protein
VLSPEELLYRCVHYINQTHDQVPMVISYTGGGRQGKARLASIRSRFGSAWMGILDAFRLVNVLLHQISYCRLGRQVGLIRVVGWADKDFWLA